MGDKGLNQRLILIGVIMLLGVWLIYPPKDRLKPGLDIAGGTSMIFEIDAEAGDDPALAENMKKQLQKRVDPKGVYDLVWRVVGRNRLEVQMPLAPQAAKDLRDSALKAEEALYKANIERSQIEAGLALPAAERETALLKLADGSPVREASLRKVIERKAKLDAAKDALANFATSAPASTPATDAASQPAPPTKDSLSRALRDATEGFEDAIDDVLSKNLDPRRFKDLLELDETSQIRIKSLAELKQSYPSLAGKFDEAIAKYKEWKGKRAFLESPQDLIRLMRGAGVLEFRIMTPPSHDNPTQFDRYREQLEKFGPYVQRGDTEQWFRIDNPLAFLNLSSPQQLANLDPKSHGYFVLGKRGGDWYVLAHRGTEFGLLADKSQAPWRLKRAGESRDSRGRRCVTFEMDAVGGAKFRELTRANINQQLGIFVDNVAFSSANIASEIGSSGEITGDFSQEKVQYLVNTMQAGALPARLKDTPISERTVGSSLGETNLKLALNAGLIGVSVVVVVMLVYYGLSGAVANVAMLMNLLLTLAAMAMLGARFNLAGIAGIILSLGMAVDTNILIFERMREERERGASLRMIIRNGYDKAIATIIDAHVTTLLTCVIIYYIGSEEIKGFGLTLGWGLVLNLFTAVFVTRTVYMLLMRYNLIKDLKMMKLIGVPNVDWYALRKVFVPTSIVVTVVGLSLLVLRGSRDIFDVEFLGGVNAEFQIKDSVAANFDDVKIRKLIEEAGTKIAADGAKLASATVAPVEGDLTAFRVQVPGVDAAMLAAMIAEPLEDGESGKLLQRNGVAQIPGQANTVLLRVKEQTTAEQVKAAISALADRSGDSIPLAGENIRRANIGLVLEAGVKGKFFNITTTETNKGLVRYALVDAMGDSLQTRPRVTYELHGEGKPLPVQERRLEACVAGLPAGVTADLTDYLGGAAIWFDKVDPPLSAAAIKARIRDMRLQPDYADAPFRKFDIIGVTPAGKSAEGEDTFSSFVFVVVDPAHPFQEDADQWLNEFAAKELSLVKATLDQEQSLRKVTTFKPQVATQASIQAGMAVMFSWLMIIGYMWVRFGRVRYGAAGVVALIHDVCVALAFLGVAGWIGGANHPIGAALLIDDFKVDMIVIAAILTIIGYSINDTIVVFDRIRETRGRLGKLTPQLINDSINQTMSRTLLTSVTVFIVLLAMYIFGGSSIRGFNYCMLIGIMTGTYSSIAIAAPLLLFDIDEKKGKSVGV